MSLETWDLGYPLTIEITDYGVMFFVVDSFDTVSSIGVGSLDMSWNLGTFVVFVSIY